MRVIWNVERRWCSKGTLILSFSRSTGRRDQRPFENGDFPDDRISCLDFRNAASPCRRSDFRNVPWTICSINSSGFSLLLYRPFAIGDVLILNTPTGKETGTVREFTLGYTKLMTDDGRWIIVPNSTIASNIIIRVK